MWRSFVAVFLLIGFSSCNKSEESPKEQIKLWYNSPATDWESEALPIGNGFIGAMFFGGVAEEQIQFSEGTLWSGGPGSSEAYNFGVKKDAWKHLAEVRKLLDEGKFKKAHNIANKELTGFNPKEENSLGMFGTYGGQQTMGDLFVKVGHESEVQNYKRELDLQNAEGRVSYTVDDTSYERTYFANYPSKVLVYQFKSSETTSYVVSFKSPHVQKVASFENGVFKFEGAVSDNNMAFETRMKFNTDGELTFENGELVVSDATYLEIFHTAATEYLNEYPTYKGNNYVAQNKKVFDAIEEKSFAALQKEHNTDYNSLFQRVQIDLGENTQDSIPTNERIANYASGTEDFGLEELYFQFGRYMMISASRPGSMPLNLQGKWNNSTNPPWANDYHMNINQQMLYWPAEVTNLHECHEPLFDYMEGLVEPGRQTAKEFFNTRGWVVNTMNNPFGYTAPGWKFPWGFFPGGAAWLSQHLWEHYEFTQDEIFLIETAYPLMKEAALFWIDYLIEDENGYLVSSPSYSPEHGGISKGASMDHQIAWDLLNNCIAAAEVLGVDADFKALAIQKRDQIFPPAIGKWGQLQEWKEDVDNPKNTHRHVSHLYAVHPGKQITLETTPELAKAASVSLNARGDEGTGWSLAWKVNFWARFKDGNRAYKLYQRLLQPASKGINGAGKGSGTYPNLFCAHPPFQLDGNMGGTAGMAEMLVQSHSGIIELLPALPDAWKNGSIKGLKARGGYELALEWKKGLLVGATVISETGKPCIVKYEDKEIALQPEKGEQISLDSELNVSKK